MAVAVPVALSGVLMPSYLSHSVASHHHAQGAEVHDCEDALSAEDVFTLIRKAVKSAVYM